MTNLPPSTDQPNPFVDRSHDPFHHPPTGSSWRWIAAAAVFLFAALLVVAGLVGMSVRQSLNRHAEVDQAVRPYDMHDFAQVNRSVAESEMDTGETDTQKIKQSIQSILDAVAQGHGYEHIDPDGYIAQMRRSGKTQSLDTIDQLMIQRDIEGSVNLPDHYNSFVIHAIDSLSEDWAVVYLSFWDEEYWMYDYPQRWWMVRRDGVWKLADYQSLDHRTSEAASYAFMYALASNPQLDDYYDFYAELDRAYELQMQGDKAGAVAILDGLPITPMPASLRDELWLEQARMYWSLETYQRMEAVLSKVKHPDRTPGVHMGLAWCAFDQDDHEAVIRHTDAYLRCVGTSVSASYVRAHAFEALGEPEKAHQQWGIILRLQPNNAEASAEQSRLESQIKL